MRHRGRGGLLTAAVAGAAMAMLSAACGVFEEQPIVATPTPAVQSPLANGGFESGTEPWRWLQAPQELPSIVTDRARSGDASLRLEAIERFPATTVAQALTVDSLPEYVSGFYFVEDWRPAEGATLYLQLIVSVRRTDLQARSGGQELHLLLAGAERPPQGLEDWRYLFLTRGEPERGEWVYFGYPLRKAFQQAFQWAPARWESFEVRVELTREAPTGAAPGSAVVYVDDLYVGPQAGAPARPES